jgi:hypothetical protein
MIKIYRKEETKTELKTPMLKVVKDGMCFADENGEYIAWAVWFSDKAFSTNCEKVLKRNGYRTDFAKWDDEGRFCGFKEDVG